MGIRETKEAFGKVKPYFLRNETLRALGSMLVGLKDVVASKAQPPVEVRSMIREATQLLARDEEIRKHAKGPIAYQPGQERALFTALAAIYKILQDAQNFESDEAIKARKLKLDQYCNAGLKLLGQGKTSEADAAFAESMKYYRDEHRLFHYIAKSLVDAKQFRRALPYVKKGLETIPKDPEMMKLFETVRQSTAK